MATVHLARQEGLGGFQKLVVVKRICDSLSFDSTYANLFLDEARLAAQLQHPNIVQITDIGKDDRGLFMVMEYLEGESLLYTLAELSAKGMAFDPAFACRVGVSLAAGLHHAHTATNSRGEATPVVHRDVTPSNVIICYNGVVKLVDFGIAKSEQRTTETKAGEVRGKVAYMAPEQVLEEPVTPATDVFQLGILLHEMLTGACLFHRPSMHLSTMALMYDEVKPPSVLQPSAPAVLDPVVMQALERDPKKRQASAEVLRQQLEEAARQIGPITGEHELGDWMTKVFAERYSQRRAMARAALSSGEGTVQDALECEGAPIGKGTIALEPSGSLGVWMEQRPTRTASAHVYPGSSSVHVVQPDRPLLRRLLWSLATIAIALGIFLGIQSFQGEPQQPVVAAMAPATFRVQLKTIPADAIISLDHREVGVGRLDQKLSKRQQPYVVTVSARHHHTQEFTISGATERLVALEPQTNTANERSLSTSPRRKRRPVPRKPGTQEPKPATDAPDDTENRLGSDILDPWAD
jgi:serine/threonine protein kinase